jgi:hypothetical protein
VQSLRILDSYELVPPHLPETAASVHGGCGFEKPPKAGGIAVVAESERSNDAGELLEVRLLAREHGVAFEERYDAIEQVFALAHDEHERSIAPTVGLDVSAVETPLDQSENLVPVAVLADMELRNQLKPDATARAALHRDREASFSVDVTRDVAIQPFLLIVRTRHVVTIVNARPDLHDE